MYLNIDVKHMEITPGKEIKDKSKNELICF